MFVDTDEIEKMSLVEIGPRMTLNPIRIVNGFINGEPIWQNPEYITPTRLRSRKYMNFVKRTEAKDGRKERIEKHKPVETELDTLF